MEITRLLISIVGITGLGWAALSVLTGGRGLCRSERLALSYVLGIGLVSLGMLFLFFTGQPLGRAFVLILGCVVAICAIVRYLLVTRHAGAVGSSGPEPHFQGAHSPLRLVDILLLCGIGFEVFYAFFRALVKPIESYDAVAIYAIKSKMLFLTRAVTADFFLTLKASFPHPDYPLNIPFVETFLYMGMRGLNDQLVKIIFPLFFAAILALMYFAVRRFAARTYALLFAFIFATIPMVGAYAANAYHELPLACYYFASAVLLFRWFERPDRPYLLLVSAVMVGLAGWTKNEGLLYCVVNTAVLGVFVAIHYKRIGPKNLIAAAAYPAIIAAILLPWIVVKKSFGIVNAEIDLANVNPAYVAGQLHKLLPIFYEFQKQIFGPKKWNIIWMAAPVCIIMNYRTAFSGIKKYIALSLALTVCGYILFYLISYVDVIAFVGMTWARFLLHFLPVVVYWLALILKDDVRI